uniref:Uncharacterized protein n=1 Tax=Anopheles atroparvus TaxID=41427 RepID=A0A182IM39_ANOAO
MAGVSLPRTRASSCPSDTVLSSSSSSRMVVAKFSSVVLASPSSCSCFSSSCRSFRWRRARNSALRRAGSMLSFRSAAAPSLAADAPVARQVATSNTAKHTFSCWPEMSTAKRQA